MTRGFNQLTAGLHALGGGPADAMRSTARLRLLESALCADLVFSHDDEQHARLPQLPLAI